MDLIDKKIVVLKHTDDLPRKRPELLFKADWTPVPLGSFTMREIQVMIQEILHNEFKKEHYLFKVIEGVRYCFTYTAVSEGEEFKMEVYVPKKIKRKANPKTLKAWKMRKFIAYRDGVEFTEPKPESKGRIYVHPEAPKNLSVE